MCFYYGYHITDMSKKNEHVDAPTRPLMVGADKAAHMCGISRTLWYDLRNAGRLPQPVRLGGRVLWRVEEIQQWMMAGCPSREKWQRMDKGE